LRGFESRPLRQESSFMRVSRMLNALPIFQPPFDSRPWASRNPCLPRGGYVALNADKDIQRALVHGFHTAKAQGDESAPLQLLEAAIGGLSRHAGQAAKLFLAEIEFAQAVPERATEMQRQSLLERPGALRLDDRQHLAESVIQVT